ncbi:HIT family protein [Campylobacter sp. RM9939]|uniref:HIT family protein n=1 Tax=Campylobacter molothri TaxID=1032242 RepID=UPI001D209E46|nr:HIT family protein [Campylobacter sp. RM10536]MBZ7952146.1 HIT family protein [Campylobacter sp. RM9939]MBZ7955620.1 HIT family protein [Campylobacter sp. RM17709]MBZ7957536.1 HIT family protein [Campylobacter sp. RM10541]
MIYKNDLIYIEKEQSQIPWIKIFTQYPYKELSDCPSDLQRELFDKILLCEKAMIEFYNPEKINIASFANYVPRVHFHIMARFKDDAYFPECIWGKQQREIKDLKLRNFNDFVKFLLNILK